MTSSIRKAYIEPDWGICLYHRLIDGFYIGLR